MAWTFGAAATNDVNLATTQTIGAATSASLVCGWYYPTTLTATRGLTSFGNTIGAEIGATTSELLLRSAHGTTNGQWTTTGAGLTVNQWTFLAIFMSYASSGVSTAIKVWTATADSPPVACTIANTVTPVGTPAGNATLYFGNKGTSTTLAFQGDIGNCWYAVLSGSSAETGPFNFATYGSLTADEEAWHYTNFVYPVWSGKPYPFSGTGISYALGGRWEMGYINMDHIVGPRAVRVLSGSTLQTAVTTLTIDGATKSNQRSPNAAAIPGTPRSTS